jgi:hypothetical protein
MKTVENMGKLKVLVYTDRRLVSTVVTEELNMDTENDETNLITDFNFKHLFMRKRFQKSEDQRLATFFFLTKFRR